MLSTRPVDGNSAAEGRQRRDAGFGHSPTSALLPFDPGHLEAIRKSHERCAALGLSRIGHADFSPLPRADLALARERNRRLFVHAAPVMELLLEQVLVSKSMVVLTDTQGTVLHSVGHGDLLERTAKIALAPGVNWSEASKGTNGMGTALVTEEPVFVHADEHFMYANDFLTCSAAPIFDPRGHLLGVLDVTGDQRSYHAHTLGLVKMSARMIENHWLTEEGQHALRLHFHSRVEFIDTLMGGILAVGEDGRCVGANRSALDLLGLSASGLRMSSVETLFGLGLPMLLDLARKAPGPVALTLPNGLQLHARLQAHWLPAYPAPTRPAAAAPDGAATPPALVSATPARAPAAEAAPDLGSLLTGDAQVQALVSKLRRVADRGIPVLILGETGTGKGLLARALHQESARGRAGAPFVAVNCASLPAAQLEAELFGTSTGAGGGLARARSGTLFLDEVAELPPALQARLLQVLQARDDALATPADAGPAVVSASHADLRERVAHQAFREDLYYRLNGLTVRLPLLRERSDVLALAQRLLRGLCPLRAPALDVAVAQLLARHPWPGNVRQLANVLRAAAALAGDEALITRAHLPEDFVEEAERVRPAATPEPDMAPPAAQAADAPAAPVAVPEPAAETATLEALELQTIARVVDELGGNISLASKRLGISRNTIYRKLKRC